MNSKHTNGESRRPYDETADQIRALIQASKLAVGTRLPPERELASKLGVPRSRLREALLALEIGGEVEIRGGSGIYVSTKESGGRGATSSWRGNPSELLRARAVLETALVSAAAARATMSALRHLDAAVAEMQESLTRGIPPIEADRRFHLLIAELEGNPLLVDIVDMLFGGGHVEATGGGGTDAMADWACALAEHEAILKALKACNPLAAAAAMYEHLAASQDRWLSRQLPEPVSAGGRVLQARAF